MKIKKVTAANDDGKQRIRFAGSNSGVREFKKEFIAEGFKRAQIEDEEVDVESGKTGLLAFLNEFSESLDREDVEEAE